MKLAIYSYLFDCLINHENVGGEFLAGRGSGATRKVLHNSSTALMKSFGDFFWRRVGTTPLVRCGVDGRGGFQTRPYMGRV